MRGPAANKDHFGGVEYAAFAEGTERAVSDENIKIMTKARLGNLFLVRPIVKLYYFEADALRLAST